MINNPVVGSTLGAELVTVTLQASRATVYTSDGQKFVSGDGSFQVPKGTMT